MLCRNNFPQKDKDDCRATIELHFTVYQNMVSAGQDRSVAGDRSASKAIVSFETVFFNNMALVLENYFVQMFRASQFYNTRLGDPFN